MIFLVGFLLYICRDEGLTPYEVSVFLAVLVMFQFWNLFNARCLGLKQSAFAHLSKNKEFITLAATSFFGQILIIQFGGSVFRTVLVAFERLDRHYWRNLCRSLDWGSMAIDYTVAIEQ